MGRPPALAAMSAPQPTSTWSSTTPRQPSEDFLGSTAFHAGNDIEFFRPVRAGDVIGPTYRPSRVEDKEGKFAGRMVAVDMEIMYRNQRDQLVAIAHGNIFRLVREQARKRGKYDAQQKEPYSQAQLEKIWDLYDSEEIRGPKPRYWEEVEIGEVLGPIVRGPLRVVEISFRNWFGGGRLTGAGGMTYGGHYYQFEEYVRRPGYAEEEETTGVPDHPHRGHWEPAFARKIGVPGIYDIAVQRTAVDRNLADQLDGRRRLATQGLVRIPADSTSKATPPG